MPKQLQPIPKFRDENEEFEFWSTHDTAEYIDWSNVKALSFPNLKPTEEIDLKLQELLVLRDIERLAKQRHTSKRALIVQYLVEGIRNSVTPNSQVQ